jgi:purine-binding chemotaxis protein CheW
LAWRRGKRTARRRFLGYLRNFLKLARAFAIHIVSVRDSIPGTRAACEKESEPVAIVNDTSEPAIGRTGRRPGDARKVVVFHLATQAYAISLEDVQEILPLAELSRPPTGPALLAGFAIVGAEPVPVIRLSRLFGFPETPPGLYTPMLLLLAPRMRLGLLVDRVSQIIAVTDDAILPAPDGYSLNHCVTGIVRRDEGPILLLSPERLLLEQERTCLDELEAAERLRLSRLEGPTHE